MGSNLYHCGMNNKPSVRDRIIDTASRLFYDQGYQATGINQIIDEASVAKSSLYQYFRTKEELLNAYLKIAEKEYFEDLYKMINKDADPLKQILSLFDYRINSIQQKNFKGCTFVRVVYELPNADEETAKLVRNYKSSVKAFIGKAVEQLKNASSKKAKEQLTNTIFYLFEGSGLESSIHKSIQPLVDAKSIVTSLIHK